MSVSQEMQYSQSNPVTKSPFGNLPFAIAGGLRKSFAKPLGRAFGFGGGSGPLATFINQATPMAAEYMPGQVALSKDIMGKMNSAYGGYQTAIDEFMKQLPGFQSQLGNAVGGTNMAAGAAQTNLEDAMSALPGRASFQEASQRALAPTREAAAARGMLEGGQAQAGEQNLLSDLAFQTMQADDARKSGAIADVSGTAGQQGQLAQMGALMASMPAEMRGALMQMIPGLSETARTVGGMPMDAMNNMMSFLTSTQNPNYSLLRMVLPQVANASKSFGGGGKVGLMG